MSIIDWSILAVFLAILSFFGIKTFSYMRSTADFLSANRSGRRYLQSISSGMSACGAVSVIAMFEVYYDSGLPPIWWLLMMLPINTIIFLSGWVYYRFRETRCLTVAQFLEVRYSKAFRIYVGAITWVSGVVNFGIFPAVSAQFFVYFCGFPESCSVLGVSIPTFIPIMIFSLGMALLYTNYGGHITVMVTDCIQGIVSVVACVLICAFFMYKFSWSDIESGLLSTSGGAGLIHPYQASKASTFGVIFFLINIFGSFYSYMSWQGSQAYNSSSISPHEQKMGAIISIWRKMPQELMMVLLAICAYAVLHMSEFSGLAAPVNEITKNIQNPQLAKQMTVPITVAHILPIGFKGLFCTLMFFFQIANANAYLHSWGSIFIQDVIMPLRKTPFTPATHIRLLQWSILGVALYAFCFGILFRQSEYILMFFAITGAIVSGAGAVMIGGLYWKRGTAAGAWTAMTIGWVMALGRIVLQQISPFFEHVANRGLLLRSMDFVNSINSQVIWFYIMIVCIASYILISLLTYKGQFNLTKMLRRGEYADKTDHAIGGNERVSLISRLLGITGEFSRTDRLLAMGAVIWTFGWFAIFVVGSIYNLMFDVSSQSWSLFWQIWFWLNFIICIPIAIWFTLGGTADIKYLFARLATAVRNDSDNGMVRKETDTLKNGKFETIVSKINSVK